MDTTPPEMNIGFGTEQQTTTAETMKMNVLVPVDESEGSYYALQWAIDHLFPTYAAVQVSVTLINVQPVFQPYIYPAGPLVYATPSMIENVNKAQEKHATAILSRALQICKDRKIKAETLIVQGDAKDKICEAAEELKVDLMVIGSRGLGPIKRAFLGSVSSYCAHHAHCPVLIVKPPLKDSTNKKD